MEYEDINLNISDLTIDSEVTVESSKDHLPFEVMFTIFCIVGVIADAMSIYIIFHFKRMRTVSNIILANWYIFDLVTLVVAPSAYRIISVLENLSISEKLVCTLSAVSSFAHIAIVVIPMVVTIHWALAAFWPGAYAKARR